MLNKNNSSRRLYPKLAAENIRKNAKTYIPYIITCIITIAMFYIICSLANNDGLSHMKSGSVIMPEILRLGTVVVGIFAVIFLFYTNSFLMKKRKKEFGLYNILGMEKRHIAKVVAFETLYVSILGIVLGFAVGIALDKAMYLLIARIMDFEVPLGFYISIQSVVTTLILFGIIFFLILLNSMRQIHISKPIELLKGGNVGEKEPKTKWVMTFAGVICLGLGYTIALTVNNVAEALTFFFYAVVLVIIGTYLLFTAGSVFVLKALKKNKGYYYKTKHFISVSGLIYRMKQNAVGLANICILSTMVLVMISSTSSLIFGLENIIDVQYPNDITIYAGNIFTKESAETQSNLEELEKIMEGFSDCTEKTGDSTSVVFSCHMDKNELLIEGESNAHCQFIIQEEYNRYSETPVSVEEGEIVPIISGSTYIDSSFSSDKFAYSTIKIFGSEYKIKEILEGRPSTNLYEANFQFIVNDMNTLKEINDSYANAVGAEEAPYSRTINYNVTDARRINEILDSLYKVKRHVSVEDKFTAREDIMGIYGGLFFLGIFLGTLFIMATILIIYYKQISEGYDDKGRFEILQKVGMAKNEVKSSIRSQVLCVFFLPLIASGIHMCFAFPIVLKMLKGLGLVNTGLYAVCTLASFLIFVFIYMLIYSITAKVYYRIVSR